MMKIAKLIDDLFVDPKLEEQLILPFEEFRPVVKKKELTLDSFIDGLTYGKVKDGTDYWEGIKAKNDVDYFKRWIFAFCSIHTTWENNVKGYEYLTNDMSWTISKDRLLEMINQSSLGLTTMRYKALWDFARKFRANPQQFYKKRNETWQECRNRLAKETYGIGLAKTSFVLNLSFPVEASVCCLDVHLLRFLGWDKKESPSLVKYEEMEQKWLDKCDRDWETKEVFAKPIP